METPQQKLDRFDCVIRLQMVEIDKLRAELAMLVDWIMGDRDALTCPQSVYNNPASTEGNRIKAATAALPFERSKLTVSVSVQGPAVLGDRLDAARTMKTVNPLLIEHDPAANSASPACPCPS
jgi:hypothetical protein